MDLRPLYDIKERLEQAAIAGTGLLGEDFRLQRAAEALRPLAAASPVFGKIAAGLEELLSAPAAKRPGLLLDVLALVDAVVYTQGKTGAEGDLVPLPAGAGGYQELPYSLLRPLLSALTGAGGGRIETVKSAWDDHPEFFSDLRVLPALIAGLGDSYGELAELDETILKAQGAAVVPLLKEGFDPAGKKEMARRVEVISALEGAGATPWLLEVLPLAKKDVRMAVLTALGEDGANVPLLLELAGREKGKQLEAVLAALAKQDSETVRDFWCAQVRLSPTRLWFLRNAPFPWISDLAAGAFRSRLEGILSEGQLTQDSLVDLRLCRSGVLGRSSSQMLDCWRWTAEHLPELEGVERSPGTRDIDLGRLLPGCLLDSLRTGGPGPLCGLSLELWEERGGPYLACALTAALLTCPAAEVYDHFAPCFADDRPEAALALLDAFSHLRWNGKEDRYESFDAGANFLHPLAQPLDLRWYGPLTRARTSGALKRIEQIGHLTCEQGMDEVIRQLFREDLPQVQEQTGAYFYHLIHDVGGGYRMDDVTLLGRCGWTRWKDLLSDRVTTVYVAADVLDLTPLTGPEKAGVLRDLYRTALMQDKGSSWPEQRVKDQIAAWEAEQKRDHHESTATL
ncbi:hypothetical protein D7V91_03960 [bacterium 1xD42-67]|nr:hypothetical protein D7V91_03960 [bacterium 1xD42-67]